MSRPVARGVLRPARRVSRRRHDAGGTGTVSNQRLYQLVRQKGSIATIRSRSRRPGLRVVRLKITAGSSAARLETGGGRIVYRFHARDLHLVLGPGKDGEPVRYKATIDGAAASGSTSSCARKVRLPTIRSQSNFSMPVSRPSPSRSAKARAGRLPSPESRARPQGGRAAFPAS